MAKLVKKKISDYTSDPHNINKGSEYGSHLLQKSIQEVGLGRSVLADKNGVLIAGNKTLEKAGELGLEDVIEVETDGKTLVVVKRTDLDINTAAGAKMKILDNTVSKHNYVEDAEVMEVVCTEYELDAHELGMNTGKDGVKGDGFGTEFELPSGDRAPFQTMSFTFADEQVEVIKQAMNDMKQTDEYKYGDEEFCGNENSNGNALFLIVKQWLAQRG